MERPDHLLFSCICPFFSDQRSLWLLSPSGWHQRSYATKIQMRSKLNYLIFFVVMVIKFMVRSIFAFLSLMLWRTFLFYYLWYLDSFFCFASLAEALSSLPFLIAFNAEYKNVKISFEFFIWTKHSYFFQIIIFRSMVSYNSFIAPCVSHP